MGHSPHGECGLKFRSKKYREKLNASLSTRRVWIEICYGQFFRKIKKSLSTRRVWIEMLKVFPIILKSGRHSPHGECGLK